jgi:hypothetical protein
MLSAACPLTGTGQSGSATSQQVLRTRRAKRREDR